MSGRVIVVGSVNVDLTMRVAQLPRPGETVTGGRLTRHHGGKSANQAVAAARNGAPTIFVGAIGDDDLGRAAHAALAQEGIDVSELAVLPREDTGVAVILIDTAGENCIAVASGANAALSAAQVADSLSRIGPDAEDVLLFSNEISPDALSEGLRWGRAAAATTILNPAPAGGLSEEILSLADVLTPNEGELAALAPTYDATADRIEVAARQLAARGATGCTVLVTLAERGAVLVSAAQAQELPALRVVVVDTVGAGDALNGTLAAELAGGRHIAAACERAVVAAGLTTMRHGARQGMPRRAELDRAAEQYRLSVPAGTE